MKTENQAGPNSDVAVATLAADAETCPSHAQLSRWERITQAGEAR